MVEAALVEAGLAGGEERIFAGGVFGLLELVEFFVYVTFVLLGLGLLRNELVHKGWDGFAHGDAADLVSALLSLVHYFSLLLLGKCTL